MRRWKCYGTRVYGEKSLALTVQLFHLLFCCSSSCFTANKLSSFDDWWGHCHFFFLLLPLPIICIRLWLWTIQLRCISYSSSTRCSFIPHKKNIGIVVNYIAIVLYVTHYIIEQNLFWYWQIHFVSKKSILIEIILIALVHGQQSSKIAWIYVYFARIETTVEYQRTLIEYQSFKMIGTTIFELCVVQTDK